MGVTVGAVVEAGEVVGESSEVVVGAGLTNGDVDDPGVDGGDRTGGLESEEKDIDILCPRNKLSSSNKP